MNVPPGVNFTAVTDDDNPSAFLAAAAETALRDTLWRGTPSFAPGCDHDWRRLPVVEFRQTVICWLCGGLNRDLSREVQENPGAYIVDDDGTIARRFEIKHRDPAEAAALIRAGYAERDWPMDIAEAVIEETLKP